MTEAGSAAINSLCVAAVEGAKLWRANRRAAWTTALYASRSATNVLVHYAVDTVIARLACCSEAKMDQARRWRLKFTSRWSTWRNSDIFE